MELCGVEKRMTLMVSCSSPYVLVHSLQEPLEPCKWGIRRYFYSQPAYCIYVHVHDCSSSTLLQNFLAPLKRRRVSTNQKLKMVFSSNNNNAKTMCGWRRGRIAKIHVTQTTAMVSCEWFAIMADGHGRKRISVHFLLATLRHFGCNDGARLAKFPSNFVVSVT